MLVEPKRTDPYIDEAGLIEEAGSGPLDALDNTSALS